MTQQNRAGSQAEALRRMGALIAARRRALGLTQKQLAARLLVSDKAVSKWELGGGYPDPALLAPLAAALDLTVDELLAGRQAGTDKVSGPLPEQITPGREQGADPAADVWLRRRLDQNMAFWALAGLLLGGAGAYLPCLINTQLAWAVSGLVLVAVVALILCLRLWYRMRCQALGCRPAPTAGLALAWLALLAAAIWHPGLHNGWVRLPSDMQPEEVFAPLDLALTGTGGALGLLLWLLPLVLLAAAAGLFLYGAGRGANAADLLPACIGLLLAWAAGGYGAMQTEAALTGAWHLAEKVPPDPFVSEFLPPVLAAGAAWLAVCAVMAWISARRGGGGWRMLPGWAAVYLLPALADLARMRCGVRLLERPPLGILCGWVGAYTPVPALLAGIAAALLCAWQAARRPGRKPEVQPQG